MSIPIELYFWPTPNGHKITIALEEMGLPYVIKPVAIGRGEQFKLDFIAISPNNKMPAIIDPDGPDGAPIAVFESGAILQYLGRKSGRFYPQSERARSELEQWLFWQVGGLGPMAGQAGHFINYAPKLADDPKAARYGRERYVSELNRLAGVLDLRLADRDYVAGDYSIADMAIWPWARTIDKLGQDFSQFPHVKAWTLRVGARAPVQRALDVGEKVREQDVVKEDVQQLAKTLFGQTAKSVSAAISKRG